jgi:hypothetical protein
MPIVADAGVVVVVSDKRILKRRPRPGDLARKRVCDSNETRSLRRPIRIERREVYRRDLITGRQIGNLWIYRYLIQPDFQIAILRKRICSRCRRGGRTGTRRGRRRRSGCRRTKRICVEPARISVADHRRMFRIAVAGKSYRSVRAKCDPLAIVADHGSYIHDLDPNIR